ncbi:MAG: GNAT family N-acetyltransferase [Tissierellia bacterium]|nr:GNAT family N-acetyltransferase [Tissierellia bacterium]
MDQVKIIKAEVTHLDELTSMAIDLWPDNDFEELKEEIIHLMANGKNVFLLSIIDENIVGFIHMSIRTDYVEGSSTSPVAYVEGIYVKPDYRYKGIGKQLLARGEEWAKSKACKEIASDILYDNTDSYNFHTKVGFKEANRLICFIKDID